MTEKSKSVATPENGTEFQNENLNDGFEPIEIGDFQFKKFEQDGDFIIGKFAGMVTSEETFFTNPENEKLKREGIEGVYFRNIEEGSAFCVPTYYTIVKTMKEEMEKSADFEKTVYKIERKRKEESKGGRSFVVFSIMRKIEQ